MTMVASSVALPPEGQVRRLALFGRRGTVARCRDFTRAALQDWGWLPRESWDPAEGPPDPRAEDVLLVVSELVTNACLHGGTPRELVLRATASVLRVEVSDANTIEPVPRSPYQPGRPGGHGLRIVSRLALDWGTERRATDKTVWLEVASPLPPRARDRADGEAPG